MYEEEKGYSNFAESWLKENMECIKIFNKYIEITDEYESILKKYGWPPYARTYTPDMNEVNNICRINKKDPNKLQNILDHYFINKLKNNDYLVLNSIQKSWIDITEIKHRIITLNEVVIAHKKSLYTLSIPIAIIQIEGILAEYFNHKGWLNYKKNKKYFEDIFSINGNVKPENSANYFILNKFYETFEWGDNKKHELSRHAILHGSSSDYATETNSTKIIYLLDYLIYVAYALNKKI